MLMPFLNTGNIREIYSIPAQTAAIIICEALLLTFETHYDVCHVLTALTGTGSLSS